MSEYVDEGSTIRGELLVFQGRKIGKKRLISKSGSHRGMSVKLYDGICWIERPIRIRQ